MSGWITLHNREYDFMNSIDNVRTPKSMFSLSPLSVFVHSNRPLHTFDGVFPGVRTSGFLRSNKYFHIFDYAFSCVQ